MKAPYPADTRAKGWRFELDMEKVKQSDTWLRAKSGAVKGALLLLWAEAWQQTPCGSLPNDDELVALLIDMAPAAFAKHRAVLMRGWVLADDGRLYHDTVTARVLAMLEKRAKDAKRTADRRERAAGVTELSRVTHAGHDPEFDTKHQAPSTEQEIEARIERDACADVGDAKPTAAGLACRAMRRAGLPAVNPGDPRLIALIGQGATPEEFAGIAAEAAQKGKGFAWVLAVLPARRAEAAALTLAPRPAAPQNHEAEKTQEWLRSRAMTPEEKAAADEARKRVMGSITVIGRQTA